VATAFVPCRHRPQQIQMDIVALPFERLLRIKLGEYVFVRVRPGKRLIKR